MAKKSDKPRDFPDMLPELTQLARDNCPACSKTGLWFLSRSPLGTVMFQCRQVDDETGEPCNTQLKTGKIASQRFRARFIANEYKIFDLRAEKATTHVQKTPEADRIPAKPAGSNRTDAPAGDAANDTSEPTGGGNYIEELFANGS